jgi:hypothetical protein
VINLNSVIRSNRYEIKSNTVIFKSKKIRAAVNGAKNDNGTITNAVGGGKGENFPLSFIPYSKILFWNQLSL